MNLLCVLMHYHLESLACTDIYLYTMCIYCIYTACVHMHVDKATYLLHTKWLAGYICIYAAQTKNAPHALFAGRLGRESSVILLTPAGSEWCGQHADSRVDSLVEALPVDPPRELSDKDGSHPLEAQLLVNAQEFDVNHPFLPAGKKKKNPLLSASNLRGLLPSEQPLAQGVPRTRLLFVRSPMS